MNPVIEAIKMRRSIRSYQPKLIPRDTIYTLIEAGNHAPSAMNSQPWRFVVVEDERVKKKLLQTALPNAEKILEQVKEIDPVKYESIMNRYKEMEDPIYYSAPAIIFVIGSGRYADNSCPLACQNIMLAAYSLGLGSCWSGFGSMVADDPEIRKMLDVEDEEKIFGPIVVGYPLEHPDPPDKRIPEVKWL